MSHQANGLTLRALLLGLVLLFLCVLWVGQVELVTFTCQITESIPPIPALAVLFFFILLGLLLKKLNLKLSLSRAELGVIFAFVTMGSVMSAVGVAQAFLPYLTVPFYFATPQNNFYKLQKFLPRWFGPRDPEVIRTFYEGAETQAVPWAAWLKPLALWFLFFLFFWCTALCVWAIFRRQWTEKERLTFPLIYIPLGLTEEIGTTQTNQLPFLKNPIMWLGFSIAFLYHLLNILHGFNPSVAALGVYYPIGSLFTEKPLDALQPLQMWYRPELVGLGYLVSLEILFSVWLFFLLENIIAVLGRGLGWEIPGFPFASEQGIGAYIIMALFLIWVARGSIIKVLKKAFLNDYSIDDSQEPIPYRWATLGLLLGFSGLLIWCKIAGMALWVALFFFALLFLFALVYCRIRAETGTPSVWALPHSQLMLFPFYTFGSQAFKIGGSFQTMSVWTHFFFLIHGGFFNQSTVYQMESFKLADELNIPRRHMVYIALLALIIGLPIAFWMQLSIFYKYGGNILAGGAKTGLGSVRISYCLGAYTQTANFFTTPRAPDLPRNIATGIGAFITGALIALRAIFLRFPLNPLGYIIATVIGSQVWWAFFVAWLLKLIVLRLGGIQLYKKLIPGFLGLAIGHFFIAGIVWSSLANFWPEVTYIIWFT